MKIIRFTDTKNKTDSYGIIESDFIYPLLNNPFSGKFRVDNNRAIPFDSILLRIPCIPSKIVALAINFEGATGQTLSMSEPLVFLKSTNTVVDCNQQVKLPFKSNTWGEAELGVVIGNTTTPAVTAANVKDYIFGYVPTNDVSCDNVDDRDHHLARSKSADGFCPLGKYIDTDYDFRNKKILAYHNDTILREGNTDQMIWDPERIVVWLAGWMTLYPGDVVITGTPPRVRDRMFLKDSDTYSVKIEGFPDLVTKFYE